MATSVLAVMGIAISTLALDTTSCTLSPTNTESNSRSNEDAWTGSVMLGGKEHKFLFIDKNGRIDSDDRFELHRADSRSAAARMPFKVTKRIFFNQSAYRIDLEARSDKKAMEVSFTEETVPTGKLEIQGGKIARLILAGDYTVVLDSPEGAVQAPVGSYDHLIVLVDNGGDDYFKAIHDGIDISEEDDAAITAGAPLENRLEIEHSGSVVRMEYMLLGAGGEEYSRYACATDPGPEYVAYHKGKQVASGKFEYG